MSGRHDGWKLYVPSVDIPHFTATFIFSLLGVVNSNLNLQRACYLILDNKKSDCEMLGNENNNITRALEGDAQYITNQIELVRQCTEAVITMVISLLIGPWTDKFGRKPGLVLTWTGFMLTMGFGVIYTSFELSPWYNLIAGIPIMLCGGFFSFIGVATMYLTDITTKQNRGVRIAVFNAFGSLGMIAGTFACSPLLKATSYFQINVITTSSLIICWIFIMLAVKESLPNVQKKGVLRGFIDFSSPKQMFITTFRKREGGNRDKILLLTAVSALYTFVFMGEISLRTLFLRKKFGWVMSKYSVFNGVSNVIQIFGTVLGTLFFIKLLKMRESVASLISFILTIAGALLAALATKDWHIYLVPVLRSTDGAQMAFITTLLSKQVSQSEIGKVLSGANGIKFLVSLFSSPVYTAVYNATLDTDAAIFNYLSAGVTFLIVLLTIWILFVERRHNPAEESAKPSVSVKDTPKVSINDVVIRPEPRFSLVM